MLPHALVDLARIDEQVGRAVLVANRETVAEGNHVDVAAPDVEQPGNRVEGNQDKGIRSGGGQPLGDIAALVRGAFARQLDRLNEGKAGRSIRLLRPKRIDRIFGQRHQFCPVGEFFADRADRRPGIEFGIITDPHAHGILCEPRSDRRHADVFVGPVATIDLMTDRFGIAAVDENGRLVRQHGDAGSRSRETAQPGEALGIRGRKFRDMFVARGENEAVQA